MTGHHYHIAFGHLHVIGLLLRVLVEGLGDTVQGIVHVPGDDDDDLENYDLEDDDLEDDLEDDNWDDDNWEDVDLEDDV